jgi:hypothetical protein
MMKQKIREYPKLSNEDKAKIPLRAVYFLAPEEGCFVRFLIIIRLEG